MSGYQVSIKKHSGYSILTWSIAIRPEMLNKSDSERQEHFDNIPDAIRRKRQKRALEQGLDLPELHSAITQHQELLHHTEKELTIHTHLAGDHASLADICVLPYVVRLEYLGWQHLWQHLSGVQQWYTAMKNRRAYALTFDEMYPEGFKQRWQQHGKSARIFLRNID